MVVLEILYLTLREWNPSRIRMLEGQKIRRSSEQVSRIFRMSNRSPIPRWGSSLSKISKITCPLNLRPGMT